MDNLHSEEIKKGQESEQAPEQPKEAPQQTELEIAAAKIAELEAQAALAKDQILRKAAEFENFKRRTELNSINFAKYASENIILDLLPVIDDLSRSLKSSKERSESDPLFKGIELIYNKFVKILESQGVKPIDSVGKEFNVDYHDVMMQVPREDVAPHVIVEEIEKGYMLYDKIIRHAKVVVAASPAEKEVKN